MCWVFGYDIVIVAEHTEHWNTIWNCCDLRLTINVGLLGVAWFSRILSSFFYDFIVKSSVIGGWLPCTAHAVFTGIFYRHSLLCLCLMPQPVTIERCILKYWCQQYPVSFNKGNSNNPFNVSDYLLIFLSFLSLFRFVSVTDRLAPPPKISFSHH